MPFDYEDYQKKCDGLTAEELHKEWENYTRQIAGGATSTATSVLFSPFTAGISLVGIGLSAPRIHNARKKREIIQAGLEARGETHNTRKRDVIAPMAVAGTLSSLTLGLAGPGADLIAVSPLAMEQNMQQLMSLSILRVLCSRISMINTPTRKPTRSYKHNIRASRNYMDRSK